LLALVSFHTLTPVATTHSNELTCPVHTLTKEECPMKKQSKRNTIQIGMFSYTYRLGRLSL
ncbi:TPA: hypothetical protein ACGOTC_002000, partial [Streptococcus suis]